MDGYIRVSRRMGREGPGYLSPTIQRQAVERWAAYRDIEIVAWHNDEDESGGTQRRPGLRTAIARVEAGDTDGIACWRLNRFARNVAEALTDVQRIQHAGGALACVEEDIDPTGPFGEFILTVLLAVAALELQNTRAGWRVAKASAMQRGAVIGPTPYGFARGADGTLTLDDTAAPVMRAAFEVAAREGFRAAVDHLVAHGEGRAWTISTVRRTLRRRCYRGEFRYGPDLTFDDPDLAIVDEATWQAAQPPDPGPRRRSAEFPLSGLAECASCGAPMVGGRGGDNLRTYRCSASLASSRLPRCDAPATMVAHRLEAHVRESTAVAAERYAALQGDDLAGMLRDADADIAAATGELDDAIRDLTLRRVLGAKRYHAAIEARVAAVDAATAHRARLASRHALARRDINVPAEIRTADLAELGRLLGGGMLASITVARGRGPVGDRVGIVFADEDEPFVGVPAVEE